jgi:hypothetical protein
MKPLAMSAMSCMAETVATKPRKTNDFLSIWL